MLPLTRAVMALFFGWFPISPAVGMCHSRDSSGSLWALYFLHMDSHLQSESRTSAAGFQHRSISQCCHTANTRCADPAFCMQLIWMYETACLSKTAADNFTTLSHKKTWIKCYSYKCNAKITTASATLSLTHNLECASFINSKSFIFEFKYLPLLVEFCLL